MSGWSLAAVHEWAAHDPFGDLKPADASAGSREVVDGGAAVLRAARGGYVSFRLLVQGSGTFRLEGRMDGGLELDLFRAWYHRMGGDDAPAWHADALIPVASGAENAIPNPDNRIDGQTAQEFWVDVHVPADAAPGPVEGGVALEVEAGGERIELPVRVEVLDLALPDEPCVVIDHNSYGCRWLHGMFRETFDGLDSSQETWARTIELLHHYYRIYHEHRGVFHNLGCGHSGSFDPIYGPRTVGSGRDKSVEGWDLFDAHYGPLFDGSAFLEPSPAMPRPRRRAAPLWGVYTPINPDWPASYVNWGEEGYEVEFVRCVGQFDAHLREKGWTDTLVEFFFNHKKRYRWFEWDGDEPKYARDDAYHLSMGRLWKKAIAGSPVKWVYRMDASWQMKHSFERLAGLTDFWVLGGFNRWYPEEIRRVVRRGDITWWYGGTPSIAEASSNILQFVFKTWVRGFTGYVAWLTVSPGPDPWFDSDGSGTASVYPGERFGIAGPIPSIRLKIERNGIQDVDLIHQAATRDGNLDAVRDEIAAGVPIQLWEKLPKAAEILPPEDWDSVNLATGIEPDEIQREPLDPLWWAGLRDRALGSSKFEVQGSK